MTQIEMFPTATSSQQDTRASPFHLPGSAEAQKMTDISGRTFFPLFKPNDPLGAFSRMFMGMSLWASTKCYLTWNVKPTPSGRSLFQLAPQTLRTDATEFGSSPEMWATPSAADSVGTTGGGQGKSLRTDVKMWPTATARDYKGGRTPETLAKAGRNETNSLPDAVNAQMGKTGSLNPQWVEWLMGYPEGWTDLED
jgi:hypothetical protein